MEIAVIGVSHKEAGVPIRGQVAFTTSLKLDATKVLLTSGLQEFMIISTCNRSEIYIASKDMTKDMDIVISATASPHVVIQKEAMDELTQPTLFLDMAVPRDIDSNEDIHHYKMMIEKLFNFESGEN